MVRSARNFAGYTLRQHAIHGLSAETPVQSTFGTLRHIHHPAFSWNDQVLAAYRIDGAMGLGHVIENESTPG